MADTPTDPTKSQEPASPGGTVPPAETPPAAGVGQDPTIPSVPSSAAPQPPNPSPPPPPVQPEQATFIPPGGLPSVEPPPPFDTPTQPSTDPPPLTPTEPTFPAPQTQPEPLAPPPPPLPPDLVSPPLPEPTTQPPFEPMSQPQPESSTSPMEPIAGPVDPSPPPLATQSQPTMPGQAQPLSADEVGPPWMRTDPSVRAAQDSVASDIGTADVAPGVQTPEGSFPWQAPSEEPSAQTTLEESEAASEGHFPVVIFVILVLGIIIAIGVFLFTQGALPFGG